MRSVVCVQTPPTLSKKKSIFTEGRWRSVHRLAQWSKYIVLLCLSAVWSLSLLNNGCSAFPANYQTCVNLW